ncbi:MAG: Spy/CpxP family protein refolding chaperone [Candidatus Aureabacteria bacterium]|nr:Spy/CpxP family protein refolding chaperone [Candidatus Auribacterota bacterium]
MKKKGVLTVLVALIVAFSFIVPVVVADGYGKGDGYRKGKGDGHQGNRGDLQQKLMRKAHFLMRNKEELGLTDEQVDKIKALMIETRKSLIKTKADIDIIDVDIKAAMFSDDIDKEVVGKLIDQKYDLKKVQAKTVINALVDTKGVLNDEQKEKAKELFKDKVKEWKDKNKRTDSAKGKK